MRTNQCETMISYHPESSSDRRMVAHATSPSTWTSRQMILTALDSS